MDWKSLDAYRREAIAAVDGLAFQSVQDVTWRGGFKPPHFLLYNQRSATRLEGESVATSGNWDYRREWSVLHARPDRCARSAAGDAIWSAFRCVRSGYSEWSQGR